VLKKDNRFFDDLAKVATGAVGALSGVREQIHAEIKSQMNRFIAEMDFVPREDFEIVEDMAREARLANQKLEKRIAELEKKSGGKKTATKAKKKK
jgi:BMFP domain-containing protein YqiC